MSNYRRANIVGATYFFTVVAYQRQPILSDNSVRHALRTAIAQTRADRHFTIDAWVLLPDHLHCIWTPERRRGLLHPLEHDQTPGEPSLS